MSIIGKFFTFNDLVRDKLCNNLNYPNVTVIKDICYDKSNEKVCTADLFFDKSKLPKSGKYPVMLKIHGGGWIVGDKKFRRGYALQLADEGVFVVNINYALAPEYTFPYPIQNCFAALAWIKNNANKYHLDLDSLFVAGDSAGAHMTAVVCAALTNPDYRKKLGCPDVDIKPVGALHYCGIYDFNTYKLRLPITRAMLRDYTGCKVKNASSWEYYGLLNPINYINSEYPPSLVVSAKKDFMAGNNHELLMTQLDKVKVPYMNYRGKKFLNSLHCFHLIIFMSGAKKCLEESRKFVSDRIAR